MSVLRERQQRRMIAKSRVELTNSKRDLLTSRFTETLLPESWA
jgi:hypothetical protein